MRSVLFRLEAVTQKIFATGLVTVLAAIVVIGGLQVFNRFVLNISLSWSEEFQRFGQAWMVFLGIPIAYSRMQHIGSTFFAALLPTGVRRTLAFVIDLTWGAVGIVLIISGIRIMRVGANQLSSSLELSMALVYSIMVVSGSYILLIAAIRLWTAPGRLQDQQETD